ncbi:polysaccharide pyruvyl transferase family protein [Altererythrobacter sp. C41]|uniref:polysaccharide pyruvyl transferase family protein n=1 Tax=Altererythrobacter sp. C41 TaxID=2806021 RepID=UPI0019323D6B|nr:polysaccharide pyruvyl transferase family protein [Altererythrobacter sp. C41]MBM0171286.1 polysaccharide pyruvyl transferase family protein [Altererythrobacter sp. C41]
MMNDLPRVAQRERRPRVLLDGPYGKANLGDNAIAYCMGRFLQRNGVDVTFSCIDPEYVERTIGGTAIPMLDLRRFEIAPLKAMSEFDAVIIGGGQQLKEYRVPNPLFGMFARVCHMAAAARRHNIPFVAWSVGMDWPLSPLARLMARHYLGHRNTTLILRDRQSFERITQLLEGKECQILQNKDAVFMIPSLLSKSAAAGSERWASRGRRLLICPGVMPEGAYPLTRLVEICIEASNCGYEVLGWHSEVRSNYDFKVREMAAWSSIPGFRWLPPDPIDTDEVAELIRSASVVITTRMHPAIIAVSQGVAAYGIAINGKMRSVFNELTMPYADSSGLTALTFADILHQDFRLCFERATAFGREAEQGGMRVLDAIPRHKLSTVQRLSEECE